MEIKKAHWTSDGEHYSMEMSLTKIDKERRLVSGWASLDNPDLQGDIVLASASEAAFQKFRGNIREMHQPKAVGRMVDYRPDSYYDPKTEMFYNGIYVTVYVSKGAQDTWEKVLDGTLQAFSIKGPITDHQYEFSKDAGKRLRIIKGYELEELSLVDAGGNQLANVVTFTKVDGNMVAKGMIAETHVKNVFWCEKDQIAKTSGDDTATCVGCDTDMQIISWYEEGAEQVELVAAAIAKHKQAESAKNDEGGENVADEKQEEVVTPPAGSPVGEVETGEQGKAQNEVNSSVEEVAAADAEKAATVDEVDTPDFAKMLDELKDAVTKNLESSTSATQEAVERIEKRLEESIAALDDKIAKLAEGYNDFTEKFNSVKSEIQAVEKRLGTVEDGTAMKKSGDLGGSQEADARKGSGVWSGSLFP